VAEAERGDCGITLSHKDAIGRLTTNDEAAVVLGKADYPGTTEGTDTTEYDLSWLMRGYREPHFR
jgi:hypothetical protein